MEESFGSATFVHSISGAGRILPSSSRWNSIELDFNLLPQSSNSGLDSLPPRYTRSIDFSLKIKDQTRFKRCCYISASIIFLGLVFLLLLWLLRGRRQHHQHSVDLKPALNQALLFFDAQKCKSSTHDHNSLVPSKKLLTNYRLLSLVAGPYPRDSGIKFRGDSGLRDGISSAENFDLVGGFYDSGNNMKFSFTSAYTVTLLSWSVIEYHEKYADVQELDHVKDVIKWGSDYLLKLFIPPSKTSSAKLFSQVGTPGGDSQDNDFSCWQRPEDMNYERPVSVCGMNASDLAGELVAGLSSAALVFKDDEDYSTRLVQAAEELFGLATHLDPSQKPGMFTSHDDESCGGRAREFYNSTGFRDELVWGATWLFFVTGNTTYLDYAVHHIGLAENEEILSDKEVFSWNNKLAASAILLTRLRYFRDPGYPYESTLISTTNRSDFLICSYSANLKFPKTKGGLILLKPDNDAPLQYAATASFLTKLYSDYLALLRVAQVKCGTAMFPLETLRNFSLSQVHYILGHNPNKLSYLVGHGDRYPTQVHHRAASIPWDNKSYSCGDGDHWLNQKDPNPNVLRGAMVAGPDKNDNFIDARDKKEFTEPSISSNAGLVAALIALADTPIHSWNPNGVKLGLDKTSLFEKIKVVPTAS